MLARSGKIVKFRMSIQNTAENTPRAPVSHCCTLTHSLTVRCCPSPSRQPSQSLALTGPAIEKNANRPAFLTDSLLVCFACNRRLQIAHLFGGFPTTVPFSHRSDHCLVNVTACVQALTRRHLRTLAFLTWLIVLIPNTACPICRTPCKFAAFLLLPATCSSLLSVHLYLSAHVHSSWFSPFSLFSLSLFYILRVTLANCSVTIALYQKYDSAKIGSW